MIAYLKPYSAIKNSGVPWLGEVPEHWEVERLKARAANIIEQTTERPSGSLYVALEHVESWTGRVRHAGSEITFDSHVKRFRAGDVLFGKLRPYLAKVTRPNRDGVCVGEFLVLRPRGLGVHGGYLEHLLRSRPVIDAINSSTFGAKMPRADWQFVGAIELTFPSLPEQSAIVRFLDYADRRIRRFIRAKQKLIKLLEEQKQAIIHRAVTRGLDPNVRLKPSGLEWLGDVPEHWERHRLKRLLHPVDRRSISGREILLSLRRDHGVVVFAEHFSRPPQGATLVGFKLVGEGQLVVNRLQANNGLIFRSGLTGVVSPDYSVFDARRRFEMEYLARLLRTPTYRAHFRRESTGLGTGSAGFLRLYDDRLLETVVFLPPMEEQRRLLASMDAQNKNLDSMSAKENKAVDLVREYRTRLIADVVTGKVDVREAAANLSDETREPGALDDADALGEDNELVRGDNDSVSEEAEA